MTRNVEEGCSSGRSMGQAQKPQALGLVEKPAWFSWTTGLGNHGKEVGNEKSWEMRKAGQDNAGGAGL